MADALAELGHRLDLLLDYLGIHGVHGLDAAVYALGVTIVLAFVAAVRSAIRVYFVSGSVRR